MGDLFHGVIFILIFIMFGFVFSRLAQALGSDAFKFVEIIFEFFKGIFNKKNK